MAALSLRRYSVAFTTSSISVKIRILYHNHNPLFTRILIICDYMLALSTWSVFENNMELERAVDVALSQIPTLKSLTLAQTQVKEWIFRWICFLFFFFARTHTNLGIKIFEIDFVNKMSWYLTFWPHLKVNSLTLGWKFYLHSALLIIPVNLIYHITMSEFFFDPPGYPQHPKGQPLGMTQAAEQKSCLNYLISSI